MGCIIARAIYIGLKSELITELFKLIGIYFATIISLHYYSQLADFVKKILFVSDANNAVLSYALIASLVVLIFTLIREGWLVILKIEVHEAVNKWGGLVISLIKGYLICGLVFLAIFISGREVLTRMAGESMSAGIFKNASFGIYQACYNGLVVKFFPDESINAQLVELLSDKKAEEK